MCMVFKYKHRSSDLDNHELPLTWLLQLKPLTISAGREVIATRTHGAADISLTVVNHAVIWSLWYYFIAWYSIARLCRIWGRHSLSKCNKKEPQECEILWSSIISTRIGWPRDLEIIRRNWETWKMFRVEVKYLACNLRLYWKFWQMKVINARRFGPNTFSQTIRLTKYLSLKFVIFETGGVVPFWVAVMMVIDSNGITPA